MCVVYITRIGADCLSMFGPVRKARVHDLVVSYTYHSYSSTPRYVYSAFITRIQMDFVFPNFDSICNTQNLGTWLLVKQGIVHRHQGFGF
jgi:hypothetical protein